MMASLGLASISEEKPPLTVSDDRAAHWEREQALEQAADALLRALPPDPDCPTFTEAQLARRERRRCVLSTGTWAETLAVCTPQSALDELRFLAAIAPLSWRERACLQGWMLGWTQREFCARWNGSLWAKEGERAAGVRPSRKRELRSLPLTQQAASRLLRRALRKCYEAAGVGFAEFSRHALYRRSALRRATWRALLCPFCHEEFVFGLGEGRYCSLSCREAARHRRQRSG